MNFIDTHEPPIKKDKAPTVILLFSVAALVGVAIGATMYLASLQSGTVADLALKIGLPVRAQETNNIQPATSYRAPARVIKKANNISSATLPEADDTTVEAALVETETPPASNNPPSPTNNSSSGGIHVNDGGAIQVNTILDTSD